MEDTNRMTECNGIQDLEESPPNQLIVADIKAVLGDTRKEIALWAILKNHVGGIVRIHDLEQRNHIGMMAGLVVQLDLSLLESSLSGVQTNFIQGLDGILLSGIDVLGRVDYSVGS